MKIIVQRSIGLLIFFILEPKLSASDDVIQDVSWSITNDGKMIIDYYFEPEHPSYSYDVEVIILSNWRHKGNYKPRKIEGEHNNVRSAGRKGIHWDIFSEVNEFEQYLTSAKIRFEELNELKEKNLIVVRLEPKFKRTLIQYLTLVREEKRNEIQGMNLGITYPQLEFENKTFQGKTEENNISVLRSYPMYNASIVIPPYILSYDYSKIDFFHRESGLVYYPDYNSSWASISDEGYINVDSIYFSHISHGVSLSRVLFPFIPNITPSIGLGYQGSVITEVKFPIDPRSLYYGWEEFHEAEDASASTSDLYVIYRLNLNPIISKPQKGDSCLRYFCEITYKNSITRTKRSWNELQYIMGISLF